MYDTDVPAPVTAPLNLANTFLIVANSLIMLATPLASRPKVIRATGPTPPSIVTTVVIVALVPSLSLLNSPRALEANSAIGVTIFKNCSPSGIRLAFRSSRAFLNL